MIVDPQQGKMPHGFQKVELAACGIESDQVLELDNMEWE